MCEFVSWVERTENNCQKIYFLTRKQIFDSPKGDALRKWSGDSNDYFGHGAIRFYYDFEGGVNKECTNFTDPENFPTAIVRAIKQGDMAGFGIIPSGLLLKPLDDKYQADRKSLDNKYQADLKPLDDKYQADRKSLDDKYQADRKSLGDKYQADRKSLDDKYWALFAIPKNRNPAWV